MKIVFYDGTCGLCHRAVRFILKRDKKQLFLFAPLQGETAAKILFSHHQQADTIVLYDEGQIFVLGQAVLRICWLLGGIWAVFGLFSFFPSCLYNWLYRWVANHRFQWFAKEECLVPNIDFRDRFL